MRSSPIPIRRHKTAFLAGQQFLGHIQRQLILSSVLQQHLLLAFYTTTRLSLKLTIGRLIVQNDFDITFGDRVAKNESEQLAAYFIKTEHWEKVRNGKADIIFDSKGAGKSALYTLLFAQSAQMEREGKVLISAEKPTEQTVFSEIKNTPPTTEVEFVALWKVYICQLVVQQLATKGKCAGSAGIVKDKLVEAGLIEEKSTLKRLVNAAMSFARRITSVESVEGGAGLEGSVTGKITFRTPTTEKHKVGFVSVDEILETLNSFLIENSFEFWILFDRLDVAFDQDPELEKNGLRALFKTYRDIEDLKAICLKVFLRDDIWKRITDEEFRESSHITRTTTISWSPQSLLSRPCKFSATRMNTHFPA